MKNYIDKNFFIGTLASFLIIFTFYAGYNFQRNKNTCPPPNVAIGVVNLSIIRTEGLAFKSFKEHIEKQYKLFHSQILGEESELRRSYESIKQLENTSKHNTPNLEKQRKEIDNRVLVLEKTIREKKDSLNSSFLTISNQIENMVQEIIILIAKKYNLNLVFNATILDAPVILYGGKELDITNDILQELDKRLPAIHADMVTVSK